jgi:hypothetical protein
MTVEQLKAEQESELSEYWRQRAIRSAALEQDQQDMLKQFTAATEKGRVMLKNVLLEQREAWERSEQEELDLIRHAHVLQREAFEKERIDKLSLTRLLQGHTRQENDGGR